MQLNAPRPTAGSVEFFTSICQQIQLTTLCMKWHSKCFLAGSKLRPYRYWFFECLPIMPKIVPDTVTIWISDTCILDSFEYWTLLVSDIKMVNIWIPYHLTTRHKSTIWIPGLVLYLNGNCIQIVKGIWRQWNGYFITCPVGHQILLLLQFWEMVKHVAKNKAWQWTVFLPFKSMTMGIIVILNLYIVGSE